MNYNFRQKRRITGYYKDYFGTWRYFRLVAGILLFGIICLRMAAPVLWNSARYYFDSLAISEAEDEVKVYGWTNERTAYVQELVESREAKAKNNEIYSWCMASGKTSFGVYVRNVQIISYLTISIIGIVAVLFVAYVIQRDIRKYLFLKKDIIVELIDKRELKL